MIRILTGDAVEVLKTLPDRSAQSCITSPPYWGLRDYGTPGQLGLEKTPAEYVGNLVTVFREVRRVLRDDGVLWLNLGDSYVTGTTAERQFGTLDFGQGTMKARQIARNGTPPGLKPKDLVGIPWRVAFALQDDGWWLRSDIIWAKPNPMPESVTDRPTKAHEYIFLLAKSQRYYWDAEAVREPMSQSSIDRINSVSETEAEHTKHQVLGGTYARPVREILKGQQGNTGRNLRTVWTIATHPYSGAHFATFPPALVEPMVKASTSERGCCPKCGKAWERVVGHSCEKCGAVIKVQAKSCVECGHIRDWKQGRELHPELTETDWITPGRGTPRLPGGFINTNNGTGWRPGCACDAGDPVPCVVLDPFFGAGTTGLVASRLGRDCIGIELNPQYAEMARRRIYEDAPLLNGGME